MRYIYILCMPVYLFGMLERSDMRVPTLYRMEPFQERRYRVEQEADGAVYICQQALFAHSIVSAPSVYCTKGEPIIIPNTDYIPYEVSSWFDGIDAIICQHKNGTLSGYFNVRRCTDKPPANVDVLGETRNAYIIKNNVQGDVVCDE